MSTSPSLAAELRDFSAKESARIQDQFAASGDGRAFLLGRSAVVDCIVERLWKESLSADPDGPPNLALVALGGYGRRWLFPFSDIDLLFLHGGNGPDEKLKEATRKVSQELWDLQLKLSPATRTLAECGQFDSGNPEFAISMLDCRYLIGDRKLFTRLHDEVIPKLVVQESRQIVKGLAELTRARHAKFGETVFHLEPNIKDGPGGLRDYNVVSWLSLLAAIERYHVWPNENAVLPVSIQPQFEAALRSLISVRCFLHFWRNRDDNTLSWETQDAVAARKIGVANSTSVPAGSDSIGAKPFTTVDWMRVYFGHARMVHHVCIRLLEEVPAARLSIHHQFQQLRSRLSNAEFLVEDGMLSVRQPAAFDDPHLILRAFHFLARHGLPLSYKTELQIERAFPSIAANPSTGAQLWHPLQEILVAPHAADALRAMHSSGLLNLLLPEFA
jgi:[protein-PII] uridylyltransferase